MSEVKRGRNTPMWREIDGLRHQSVGQLRVKYLEVFRLESRSNNQKFLDFQKGLRSSNPQLRLFGDKDSALPILQDFHRYTPISRPPRWLGVAKRCVA